MMNTVSTIFLTIGLLGATELFKSCTAPECSNAAEYYDIETRVNICRCVQGNNVYHVNCEYVKER
jgi:hypothetical protein